MDKERLDLADWLITEGYGTPYRVRVDGFKKENDHFTIPCLGKSIMAIRLTYFTGCVDPDSRDIAEWGENYTNNNLGRKEKIYYLRRHLINLDYLSESGWVSFVVFDTKVLQKDTLDKVTDQKRYAKLQRQKLLAFEEKIRSLLDHMITFHGLSLV